MRSSESILKSAPTGKFFTTLSPTLATLVDKPVDGPQWVYEIKWDGYRAVAFMNKGEVELKSRNDNSFNKKFYPVFKALQEWKVNAIVDGEVVVLNKKGVSDFEALQNWRNEKDGPLKYYVFDLLWLEGRDLRKLPLTERRQILEGIIPESSVIRFSEALDASGTELYKLALASGLEGIIAKRKDSIYLTGARTSDWLKIKAKKRQEVIIAGYTKNTDTSKEFSALIGSVYKEGRLAFIGKIGTGFTARQQKEMLRQFAPLETDHAPFDEVPDVNKPTRFNPRPSDAVVTWLKPKLVCEVAYAEITNDGIMRHPSFIAMRTDKDAGEVVLEQATPPSKTTKSRRAGSSALNAEKDGERKEFLGPIGVTQTKEIDGHLIKFTHLNKLYWPEDKVSKRDMINYYYEVAPYLLPYLENRPQSLNRFPDGIHGESFYQKDVTGKVPKWVHTYLYRSADEKDVAKHFLVPHSEADILLMATLGCIEIHPWFSTVDKPMHPGWCAIDLDPDKSNSFNEVIEVALMVNQVLKANKVKGYCKTSGSTGIHIYIPLGAKYTYKQSQDFGRAIATLVNHELPKLTSVERMIGHRKGKIYIDFLQNRPQATLAAPYSLRPKPGAPVSMPLHWEEVKKGLKITDFNIHNAISRIREVGDIFKPVLGKGVSIPNSKLTAD